MLYLTRCNALGNACEEEPFLILYRDPITNPTVVAKILASRAGDNIYPDNTGFGTTTRVTLEDYAETIEYPLGQGLGPSSIPASLRGPFRSIRGPGYVTFR